MRHAVLIVAGFAFCALPVDAGYDYVVEDGYASMTLNDHETLLMTGGGGHHLSLYDFSQATIQGTDPLVDEFTGGIWQLSMGGYTYVNVSGGDIHELVTHSDSLVDLSGGRIDEIRSYQSAYTHAGWPDPHITFVCDVESVVHDVQTNMLTGDWLGGTGFEIQLIDITGYDPVIENIQFIPEPATLTLLGLGGLLIRRNRHG